MRPDTQMLREFVQHAWTHSALPELIEYIEIPNKSPAFDPDWQRHGHMDRVVDRFVDWAQRQEIHDLTLDVVRLPDRTPLIFMEIPGDSEQTVLLYGHLDKQPEMTGWRTGLGPWEPVLEGDRLYGRGGADDGYAMFASLIAIHALRQQNIPLPRCVLIIEACEESGSYDLPHYIDHLAVRIGKPELVVCLDSGCGNYEQLWNTTSLRGLVGGRLDIEVLTEGVHSGDAGGIVPSCFAVLRLLLDRLEDAASGRIAPPQFNVGIPAERLRQAEQAAGVLGSDIYHRFPFIEHTRPLAADPVELILNRTWRPALEITGLDRLPAVAGAGNVHRPGLTAKLSLRLPPCCDAGAASETLRNLMEAEPPFGARVRFEPDWQAAGWHAPAMAAWLEQAINEASMNHFGKPAMQMGEGGTIPFMGMLGEKFPEAQFLITGVLGPQSNAHGPNEFLHIPTAMKLTCCVAEVLARLND